MTTSKKYLGYHDERNLPLKKGDVVTLKVVVRGCSVERLSRLLASCKESIPRLEAALLKGWDVASQLDLERQRLQGYSLALARLSKP